MAKIETLRLRWVRYNQKKIKAEKYSSLQEAVNEGESSNAGIKIILPPTIYSSPRWYSNCYQDAMAIVRSHGKPDLFITMTCNPKWEEITNSLFPGEQPSDRPDITARVFHLKANNLIEDLTKNNIFGRVKSYICMKEDQKRGLPHVHILLTLVEQDKPRNANDIDRIISAELPDKNKNPKLYEIITKHNIHGPCGALNPHSPCMNSETHKCDKDFPKEYRDNTAFIKNSYPEYRRRSPEKGGFSFNKMVNGQVIMVDNRSVVPYNPFLSFKNKSHINVEVLFSIQGVKYIHKYITKGSDRVMVDITPDAQEPEDEIENFVNARYISASEAFWRIYEFPIQKKYPPVLKLSLHLEDQQTVFFDDNPCSAEQVVEKGPPETMLTKYFELNQNNPQEILYPDMPKHFVWSNNKWKPRSLNKKKIQNQIDSSKSDMIGRIPIVSLNARQSELYFLRMILYHKPGATSFKDLKFINGIQYPTYQMACIALGLFQDNTEIDKSIEEVFTATSGKTLRSLFTNILVFINPANPLEFWQQHHTKLSEDFTNLNSEQQAINLTLLEIQDNLERHGYSLKDFNLPQPDMNQIDTVIQSREFREEYYDTETLKANLEEQVPKLNQDQKLVYDIVMNSVQANKGYIIAVDAPGGTGKTFLLETLLATVRYHNGIALATATSGIASTLLTNGRTLHSRFKIPLNINEESMCNISKSSSVAQLITKCKLLIIDEVTMAHKFIFEAMDRTFQELLQSSKPMGGITTVLSGDWRQILPVVRRGTRADIVDACLKNSYLWQHVQTYQLKTNMRILQCNQKDDQMFADYLLQIGEGRTPIVSPPSRIKIDSSFICHSNSSSKQPSPFQLCNIVYNNIQENYTDGTWLTERTIICPTNEDVNLINDIMINIFPGPERHYFSFDSLTNKDEETLYPIEFINTITVPGLPQHKLTLKIGAPIMLLRNFDPINGHCNGSRYIIQRLYDNTIEAALMHGPNKGKVLLIPRIPLSPSDNIFPFQLIRKQFPIRLSFAITSNKSQGQTLKQVGLYLMHDFFTHGQLYVAMSRVGNKQNLKILTSGNHNVNNVVYKEIL